MYTIKQHIVFNMNNLELFVSRKIVTEKSKTICGE